jgi:hypothetical protein
MPISRSALACACAAGAFAAVAVADQRVGLALSVALLLVIAAGVLAAKERPAIAPTSLAVALASQPLLRDAGWVIAADVVAAVVAAAVTVRVPSTWPRLLRALLAPFRLIAGTALIGRAAAAMVPAMPGRRLWAAVRGLALGSVLIAVFGGLFVTADKAFADVVDNTLTVEFDANDLVWRALLGLLFIGLAGTLARAGVTEDERADTAKWAPGEIELRIALSAVVALFALFVVVQLHVLFGGAAYVQKTTGLGYGEYARQGFVQLLVVAVLTLAVVGVAARRPDRGVRGLLGALCILTVVVLVSAYHRLELVEDAYGLTRVRYTGDAIVAWFVVMFGLVIAAGLHGGVARAMPRAAMIITLVGVLAFSLSNPDGRIAQSAVDRGESGRPLDSDYLAGLSADALPALERLRESERAMVVGVVRDRLRRPDGIAGANLARASAR